MLEAPPLSLSVQVFADETVFIMSWPLLWLDIYCWRMIAVSDCSHLQSSCLRIKECSHNLINSEIRAEPL